MSYDWLKHIDFKIYHIQYLMEFATIKRGLLSYYTDDSIVDRVKENILLTN